MTRIPTECEVALLSLRASTSAQCRCDDCQQHAARLRQLADQDAGRCRVALTQLVQRELSILCTDAFCGPRDGWQTLDELCHPTPRPSGQRASRGRRLAAAADAFGHLPPLHTLLDRAITPKREGPGMACAAHRRRHTARRALPRHHRQRLHVGEVGAMTAIIALIHDRRLCR